MTANEEDLLIALCSKARVFSIEQVAREWFAEAASPRAYCQERMRTLRRFVEVATVSAHPLLDLQEPIVICSPGDPQPDFEKVSYRLTARWTGAPEPVRIAVASQACCHHFGAPYKKLLAAQVTHDLHLAELYLRARRTARAESWVSETELARFRQSGRGGEESEKLPDAALLDSQGQPRSFIEFGGQYPAGRVERFHRYCAGKGVSYELW